MNTKKDFCERCGYQLDSGKYTQVKTISCPICNHTCYRVKAIYRQSMSESFICTNESCRVRIVVLSRREKNEKI